MSIKGGYYGMNASEQIICVYCIYIYVYIYRESMFIVYLVVILGMSIEEGNHGQSVLTAYIETYNYFIEPDVINENVYKNNQYKNSVTILSQCPITSN